MGSEPVRCETPPMSDDAFLNAIRSKPADRSVRLIYADWLEERRDPRSELIRICEAMRRLPVFADEYWRLKARRNELRAGCPLDWLAATGYDGSDYDPIFRDGVPDDWRGRWRLIREFTERWHGIDVPDVGGQREAVRQAEERLGLALPPSLQEYIAYAHDPGIVGTATLDRPGNFDAFREAHYRLDHVDLSPAVSLMYFSLTASVLGVAREHLSEPDPPTAEFSVPDGDYYDAQPPRHYQRSLTLSILDSLIPQLPTAGAMSINLQLSA